ncbi:MAG: 3-oxoacyl-[acyl-carrier-protein] reductase [Actinobacteria bacterium]|nr:3-oxoacyl-[acyl-carrier-protein] reductase [Cyanobacteriota bacterium]MCL5771989.1 3-oxoacyl-[acyl-carrier-protein] reductase [Actinomycetota bacterium]
MKLKEKICIVTGGARGIGKEICNHFLKEGALVCIFDLNEVEALKTLQEFSAKFGEGKIYFFNVDVTDEQSVENSVEDIIGKFKVIDVLVNNAGITSDNLILRMSIKEWERVIDINLTGTFICSKYVSKYMLKQKSGKIINMSSVIGIRGNVGQCNYSASKAGVIGLTKSLAREFASRNINVNAIAPGYIETEMTQKIDEKYKEKIISMIPSGKLGTVEDVAKVAVFLASNDSDYITGTVINLDGGMGI